MTEIAPLVSRAGNGSARGRRLVLAGLAALAVLGALALRSVAVQPDARPVARPRPATGAIARPPELLVDRRQLAAFAVLRSPTVGMPATVPRQDVRTLLDLDPALAHPLPTAPRGRFWVVPGRESLCLLDVGQAGQVVSSCVQTADALRHGVALTLIDASTRRIVGVAPDGTRRVRIRTDRASVTTARVVSGVFDHRDHSRRPPDRFALMR